MNGTEDQAVAEGAPQSYEQAPTQDDPWEKAVSEGTKDIKGAFSGDAQTHTVNVPGVGPTQMRPASEQPEVPGAPQAPTEDFLDQIVDIPGVGPAKYRELVQWRNQGLMEADYRRKTQALAEIRRQTEAKTQENEQTAKLLFQYITQLQAQQGQQAPQTPQGFSEEDMEDPYMQRMMTQDQSRISPLYERIEALEKANQQYADYLRQQEHQVAVAKQRTDYEGKFEALQKEFEFMDPATVAAWLYNDPSQDIRELARQSHMLNTQRYQAYQAKVTQQQTGPQTRRTVPPRSPGSPPLSTEPMPVKWDEAIQGAKEWLKTQRG